MLERARTPKALLALTLALIVALLAASAPARTALALGNTFYVALNGNDGWSGTLAAPNAGNTDGPFRTIQRAANAASAGDTVQIRAGTYRETVTPPNSGTAANPLIFKNYPGETAIVSGADPLSGSWSALGGGLYSLGGVGGFSSSINQAEQLFVDGQMQNYAQIPNAGLDVLRTPKFFADSATPFANVTVLSVDANNNPDRIRTTIYDSELTQSATDYYKGMTVAFAPQVSYQFVTAPVLSSAQGSITFEYSLVASSRESSVEKGDAFYLFGKPQGVTSANVVDGRAEWYRDPSTSTLYLRTPLADNPAGHTVEMKRRDYAFNLDNRSYITVQGLTLFAATITTDTGAGDGANGANGVGVRQGYDNIAAANHIVIDGIRARYLSHFTDRSAFVYTQWANNSGIILSGSDNELKNSVLEFSAGNGVSVTGVRSKVTNNVIHEVAYSGCECAAIMTGFNNTASRDHEFAYNTAYNSGKNLVLFRNLENTSAANPLARIHHNDFSNAAVADVHDTGVLYTWSDAGRDLKGLEIDHNLLHDAYDEVAGVAIYLDSSISGLRIHHNVAWNSAGIITGGQNNLFYNNTISGAYGSNIGDNVNTFIRNNVAGEISAFNTATWQASDNLLPPSDGQFCAPQAANFALRPSSPARNSGATIAPYTDGSLEGAPDRGAYEFDPANPCVPNWTAGSSLALPTPLAPSNLAATGSTGRVDLTWTDNATNEQFYYVERNDGGHIWRVIATLPPNSTSYADTSLLGGSYRYRVRADNSPYSVLVTVGAGRSALGNTLANSFDSFGGDINNIGGQAGTVGSIDVGDWLKYSSTNFPSGITSLTMILESWNTCNNTCHLEFWQDALPPSLGGSGGYKIADLAVVWSGADFSGFIESSTTVGSGYRTGVHDLYVTVTGQSLGNLQKFQFFQGATPPNAPSGLSATGGAGQVALSWSDNATTEDLYKVERSLNQIEWAQVAALPANSTSYTDAGLNSGTSYAYRVRAYNAQGNGAYSASASAQPSGAGLPAVPSQLVANPSGAGEIQLRWYDTSLNETGFTVDRATDAAFSSGLSSQNLGANSAALTVSGLAANTAYYFRVRASNGAGSSANSAAASATTPAAAPAAPGTPSLKALGAQRMLLSWADQSLNESEFAVERSPDGSTAWAERGRVGAGATQYLDTGLSPSTTYFYRVRALNGSGSAASASASAATLASRVGLNTQIEAESFDSSSLNNNVPSVDRNTGVGGFDQYDWVLLRDVDFGGGFTTFVASVATDATGKQLEVRIDERLGPVIATLNVPNTGAFGTYQSASVAASQSASGIHDVYLISKNQGAFNLDWLRFDSNNTTPVPPSNVYIPLLVASGSQMQLSWSDNSNNESGFTIERNASADEAAGSWVQAGTVGANVTSFTDSGLSTGTTYSYRVKATNSFGSSAYNATSGDRIWRATTRVGHSAGVAIQAEAYQLQSGTLNNWLYGLSGLDDGDWVMYSDVALGGVSGINITLATPNSGNTIEVRSGSPTGTLLGTLIIAATGDYGTYTTQSATLSAASGTAAIYLVFRGGYGIANLDSLTFTGSAPTPTNTPVPPTATATRTNTPVPPTATATPTNTPVPPTATATATPSPVPGGGLPSPWQSQAIGGVSVPGSASYSGGTFSIDASGNDIWYAADAFRYVYQPLYGNGQIIARVTSIQNTNSWAKAGVMIRESLADNAKHAFMLVSASEGVSFQRRTTTGGQSADTTTQNVGAPQWVRLTRSGNTLTGAYSSNGSSWTTLGSATVSMGSVIYVGLAVTAHDNNQVTTATFTNVQTSGTRAYAITGVGYGSVGGYAGGENYISNFSGYGSGTSNAIDTSGVVMPAPQAVYQGAMNGSATYTLPNLTVGRSYKVRLHFAELYWTAAGERLFNVTINGATVLSSFDIYAAAGAKNRAVVREFTTTANSSGAVVVQFATVRDLGQINGMEIIDN